MDRIPSMNYGGASESGSTIRLWKSKVKPLFIATTSAASEKNAHHHRSKTLRSTVPNGTQTNFTPNKNRHIHPHHKRTLTDRTTLSNPCQKNNPSNKTVSLSNLYKTEAYADAAKKSALKWKNRTSSNNAPHLPSWLPPTHQRMLNTYKLKDTLQTSTEIHGGRSTPKLGSPDLTLSPIKTETTMDTTTVSVPGDETDTIFPSHSPVSSDLSSLNLSSNVSWGNIMLQTLFNEHSHQSIIGQQNSHLHNEDIPKILLSQWLEDDQLRANDESEALVSIRLSETMRALRCLHDSTIDFSLSQGPLPCGCSGGSLWRMRVDSKQYDQTKYSHSGWTRQIKVAR